MSERRAPPKPSPHRIAVVNALVLLSTFYLVDAHFFDGAHSTQLLMTAGGAANSEAMRLLGPVFNH